MGTIIAFALLAGVIGFAIVRPRGLPEAAAAVLSLDATVVLLTPVVFATAERIGARPRPYAYACAHLANSASLLLPVSNLTNLLAFSASGLSFGRFAVLMAAPWLAVVLVELAVFRRFFRADLATPAHAVVPVPVAPPRFALIALGLTLAGFAIGQPLGVNPALTALAGALVLAAPLLRRRTVGPIALVREINPAFCVFVFGLGVVVLGVRGHGLGRVVDALAGSLATLLWRQIVDDRDAPRPTGEFLRLGALTVPLTLAAAVAALWVGLRVSAL